MITGSAASITVPLVAGSPLTALSIHRQAPIVVPKPRKRREDMQNAEIRSTEVPTENYYPEGYHPQLIFDWPTEGDLVAPVEAMPDALINSFGENWRYKESYRKHISQLAAKD